ncbi:HD domain-containing phosphohydrolase [Solicola gregarius]|uniref:LuxR C-terminal-related transcriptional regulator n=1 Tax=Solicola gregarius TaxID=2908642 RepID=A0AA46YME2_9ACTN|nr:HD domain-containing phosphohydrolase [Solicola gregarius]UYM05683.1 LuxR C-terminal-related transcriptional regulator [Solicola gregarius]
MAVPSRADRSVSGSPPTRRAELLAALSLAIDLGLGQPMEHMLRACVLGTRIAQRIELDQAQQDRVFYATLVSWIGCHADSYDLAGVFGDDIGFRADTYAIDKRGVPLVRFMVTHAATDPRWTVRTAQTLAFLATGRKTLDRIIRSHCVSAGVLATHVGTDEEVAALLAYAFERWDGAGLPDGARHDTIPIEMRIVHLCDTTEVHVRERGREAAIEMLRARRGTQFDPDLVDAVLSDPDELLAGVVGSDAWEAALANAPAERPLNAGELTDALTAIGDFADLKSPYTAGHSRAVASLATDAARVAGLDPEHHRNLLHAGLVHDLGRLGVSNAVWDKQSPLTTAELERVRLHPYLTERILNRVPGLAAIAPLAGAHHERLDGSGYARGLKAAGLDQSSRILAAADRYRTATEPRPHRSARTPAEAAELLRGDVRDLRLDGPSVEAVLTSAGHRARRRHAWPAGLTDREVEVLRRLIHGLSNRQIATELSITEKTARNHLEHIYAKLGVANRTSASLFAVQHGIVDSPGHGN